MVQRFLIAALLLLVGVLSSGCYQTYDPYTGYNKYWPEFNLDYINELQPALDGGLPVGIVSRPVDRVRPAR